MYTLTDFFFFKLKTMSKNSIERPIDKEEVQEKSLVYTGSYLELWIRERIQVTNAGHGEGAAGIVTVRLPRDTSHLHICSWHHQRQEINRSDFCLPQERSFVHKKSPQYTRDWNSFHWTQELFRTHEFLLYFKKTQVEYPILWCKDTEIFLIFIWNY